MQIFNKSTVFSEKFTKVLHIFGPQWQKISWKFICSWFEIFTMGQKFYFIVKKTSKKGKNKRSISSQKGTWDGSCQGFTAIAVTSCRFWLNSIVFFNHISLIGLHNYKISVTLWKFEKLSRIPSNFEFFRQNSFQLCQPKWFFSNHFRGRPHIT